MKGSIVTMCVLAACISTARAAADTDSTRAIAGGTLGSAPLSQGLLLSRYYSRDWKTPAPTCLSLSLNPLTIQPYAPTSRFDAAMLGAGTAGALGMFVGALGNTFGLFDEKTTWLLTGALAAGGAIYGGAKYEIRPTLRPESFSNVPAADPR